jgi:hypothetical protein
MEVVNQRFRCFDLLVVALQKDPVAPEARCNAKCLLNQHEIFLEAVEKKRKFLPGVRLYLYRDRNSSLFVL